MQDPKERREFPRLDIKAKILINELEGETKKIEAVTKNFSAEGMSFTSVQHFKKGAVIEVALEFEKLKEPIIVKGKVIWSEKVTPEDDKELYATGIKILDTDKTDEAKLTKIYINEVISNLGGHLHL